MEMLQGVWKQHLRPRVVVGYGVKFFLSSPPNYVTRSPGYKVRVKLFTYAPFISIVPIIVTELGYYDIRFLFPVYNHAY